MNISVLFSVDGQTALVGGAASGMGCTSAEVVGETGGLLYLSSAKKLPEAAGAAGWMVALSRLPCWVNNPTESTGPWGLYKVAVAIPAATTRRPINQRGCPRVKND